MPVWINEFHYDNGGTDTNEFIEVASTAGTDLTGWSIVLYNGTGGAPYGTVALSGTIPNQQNGFGTLTFAATGLQNGAPDGFALVNGTTVIQFLSYEGAFTAVGGPANGMVSVDVGPIEGGSGPTNGSIALTGTGDEYSAFAWALGTHTSGATNTGQSFGGVTPPSVSVGDVTVTEGNAGTILATFTVTRSGGTDAFSVNYAPANGTAE